MHKKHMHKEHMHKKHMQQNKALKLSNAENKKIRFYIFRKTLFHIFFKKLVVSLLSVQN